MAEWIHREFQCAAKAGVPESRRVMDPDRARVVIEDWRWKYNHVRPHRSLGYITPNEYAQDEVGEEAQGQCRALGRATPSLRPSIDLLYDIEQIINPSRLTNALDQFG